MLQQPKDTGDQLVVLGLDPGTSTLGVSILTWDFQSPTYQVINAFTLHAKEGLDRFQYVVDYHTSRQAQLAVLSEQLSSILAQVRPHVVIMEAPFLGRFVTSFEALTECRAMIRHVLMAYDQAKPLYEIDPIRVKEAVGVQLKGRKKGELAKEDTRDALRLRADMQWGVDLESLDEHAVDASAVGMYFLLTQL